MGYAHIPVFDCELSVRGMQRLTMSTVGVADSQVAWVYLPKACVVALVGS